MRRRKKVSGVSRSRAGRESALRQQAQTATPETLLSPKRKKSLGQNFLHNAHYIRAIADAGEIVPGEVVLEVGPGEGALTKELLARGATVIAVEKDHRLIPLLEETFADTIARKQLVIVEADALDFDISKYAKGTYKVIANIPYYITGALIKKLLTSKKQPSHMVLLVQKEVAGRIAREKKESILSLSIKAYGEPKYIKTVPRGAFHPAPNVDSAILRIENISRKHFKHTSEEKRFFELLHAGFGQKRKLLASNLKPLLGENVSGTFVQANIPIRSRAEDLSLKEWLALVD